MDIARRFKYDPRKPLKDYLDIQNNNDINDKSTIFSRDGIQKLERHYDINDVNDQSGDLVGPGDDKYSARIRAAQLGIPRPDYPPAMIPWLRKANPKLYIELTSKILDDVQRIWSQHRPLEELDNVLTAWREAHQTACALFRTSGMPSQNSVQYEKDAE
jgi:hypothetical protein